MPDRAFIRRTLIEMLEADTGEKHDDLAEDASLREGLGLDSVDVVSIVSQIERRFHIRMSQQELEKLADGGRCSRSAPGQARRAAGDARSLCRLIQAIIHRRERRERGGNTKKDDSSLLFVLPPRSLRSPR